MNPPKATLFERPATKEVSAFGGKPSLMPGAAVSPALSPHSPAASPANPQELTALHAAFGNTLVARAAMTENIAQMPSPSRAQSTTAKVQKPPEEPLHPLPTSAPDHSINAAGHNDHRTITTGPGPPGLIAEAHGAHHQEPAAPAIEQAESPGFGPSAIVPANAPTSGHEPDVPQAEAQQNTETGPSETPHSVQADANSAAVNNAAVAQFESDVESQCSAVEHIAQQRKTDLSTTFHTEKTAIQHSFAAEGARLDGTFEQSVSHVSRSATATQARLHQERDHKVAAAQASGQADEARVGRAVQEKQSALQQTGDQKINSAHQEGQRHAGRAVSSSSQKASQATAVIDGKTAQHGGSKIFTSLTSVANRIRAKLIPGILQTGADLSRTAIQAVSSFAGDLSKSITELSTKFEQLRANARQKINTATAQVTAGITRTAAQGVARVQTGQRTTVANLTDSKRKGRLQLGIASTNSARQVDRAHAHARLNVDQTSLRAKTKLQLFKKGVAAQARTAAPAETGKTIEQARTQLAKFSAEFATTLLRFGADWQGALKNFAGGAQRNIGKETDRAAAPIQRVPIDFDGHSAAGLTQLSQKMSEGVSQGKDHGNKVVAESADHMGKTVSSVDNTFGTAGGQFQSSVGSFIDAGLAKNDEAAGKAPADLDGAAGKLNSSLTLGDVGDFLWGIVVGFVDAIGDIFKGIGHLFELYGEAWESHPWWTLLATIVVIVIVVVLFLTGIAEAVGGILLYVGVFLGVASLTYYTLSAIFDEGLSPFERGKLIGRALFELLLVVLVFLGIAKAGKAAGTLGQAGNVARLAELVKDADLLKALQALAKNDDLLLKVLETGVDARKLLTLLQKVNSMDIASQLLNKIGNIDLVLELVDLAGGDSRLLLALLDTFDAAAVKNLLKELGVKAVGQLVNDIGVKGLKELVDALGVSGLKKLLSDLAVADVVALFKELGADLLAKLLKTAKGAQVKQLLDALTGPALKLLAEHFEASELLELINTHKVRAGLLKDLALLGAAKDLKACVALFGGLDKLGGLLAKADAVGMDVKSLKSFLANAIKFKWNNLAGINTFFDKVKSVNNASLWGKAVEWASTFAESHKGTVPPTAGGAPGGTSLFKITIKLLKGGERIMEITSKDLEHFQSRHTFEQFVFAAAKNANSMFTVGTDALAVAEAALNDPAVATTIETLIANNQNFKGVEVLGGAVQAGIDIRLNRLVNLFPPKGDNIVRAVAEGIKALLGK
jgi:hypothetical protein